MSRAWLPSLRDWFGPEFALGELISQTDEAKAKHARRIAYQIPENSDSPCGRTFEDAFILANPELFELAPPSDGWEETAAERASAVAKSAFAVRYAIEETDWAIPRYIAEGLRWLLTAQRGRAAAALGDEEPAGGVAVGA